MKGQSSVEYLATYGWMALAITVSGAALYSTVDTGCSITQGQTFGNQDLSIERAAIAQNQLVLQFTSNSLNDVEIQSINITNKNISRVQNVKVDAEGINYVLAKATKSEGNCKTLNTKIIYSTEYLDNLGFETTLKLPIETLEQLVIFLKEHGGSIPEVKSTSTIRPTHQNICLGDKCPTTEGEQKTAPKSYVNRSGDQMTGTLRTHQIQFECLGDRCPIEKGSLQGYVNRTRPEIDGTLNTTQIKPINEQICIGNQKCN